jgi:HlyD family secretion protein
VHTAGEVVSNAQTIMEIVPKADRLVVDAKVAPQDIDQLALGAKASVRVMAGDQRAAPVLFGELTRISADVTRDTPNQGVPAPPYFGIRVSLKRSDFRGASELQLLPGMQAEVFVETYARTPLQYLLKPLREQIAHTFRER